MHPLGRGRPRDTASAHLPEGRDCERASEQVGLVHHITGGTQPNGTRRIEDVCADVKRIRVHP